MPWFHHELAVEDVNLFRDLKGRRGRPSGLTPREREVALGLARSGGVPSCVEVVAPRGPGPPLHRHDVEDELFSIADGEVRCTAGDVDEVAVTGGTVRLPTLLPHRFQVLSDTARIFQVTTPAQFEHYVAVGSPMEDALLPEPVGIDGAQVAKVCADFPIEVLGPPPPLP